MGTVNKVGADYLGLLVLGFINASVAADQIRAEFRPRFLVRGAPACSAVLALLLPGLAACLLDSAA